MAKQVRSVDFLPEIFRTPVNEQFLSATLDQLIQNPQFTQTQGFIGRKVGPGVNANDKYVVEPTQSRTNYQLEPGVIQIDSEDSKRIVDAITYPGINDALELQGGYVNNADRIYTSDYYTWDPFVDFDKFVNYAQYYWLPDGPLAVDVSSTLVPETATFTVTRANGAYTFSGIPGNNPQITLARGGSYFFDVAQNPPETVTFRVTNNETSSWNIDYQINPTLTLVRGNTYNFNLSQTAPWSFYIKTELSFGTTNLYSNGVFNNGGTEGFVTFTVPQDAPNTLFYCNDVQLNLRGQLNIVDATPGDGPGFWIQSEPGVNGTLAVSPNISSRDVLGVFNNGTDLGTVRFDVPLATAQDFYFDMPNIGQVDLVTNLAFDQIDGVYVSDFLSNYPTGIDGISNLLNRTLVFITQDTPPTPSNLYGIWRIQILTDGGGDYYSLQFVQSVALENKFTIGFGDQYSTTSWYKNSDGYFSQIPLLTADQDVIYYQDDTDPAMFGQFTFASALNVLDIIGAKNYTSPNGVVFTNGMKVVFRGAVVPAGYVDNEYYVEGVGTAIQLLPVTNFIVPETYNTNTLTEPAIPDYLTVNRSSPDLNAWTRSNRWFHIDVINYSYERNDSPVVIDNDFRAKRPILEFRGGTRLYDFGTQGLGAIDIIDFVQTDAISNVNGSTGYSTNGYTLVNGSTIVFAADTDPAVRNKIYQVEFVVPDTVPPLIPQPIIVLNPIATVLLDQSVVVLNGVTLKGQTYYFDGDQWVRSQQKNSVNQPPLFNVYDSNGISFGNQEIYPSSNFAGSPLFSYAIGNANPDLILGFPLTYLSLTNLGDIVFDNNLYKDSFTYTINNAGQTVPLSSGFVREYADRVNYINEIGWQTAVTKSLVRQQFQFSYNGGPLQLDVAVSADNTVPAIQIYANGQFQESSTYFYTIDTAANTTTINLLNTYELGDLIEVQALSSQVSKQGFYEVPMNLNNNPLNQDSPQFTLGSIRNHYSSIAENLVNLSGPVIGANNTRDLGNIVPYGLQILQQSSPLTLTGYFMRNLDNNIFASIAYNSAEYIKFKSQLLNAVTTFGIAEYNNWTTAELLDASMAKIINGRTSINSFYWSDMLPSGPVFTSNSYTVNAITTNRFNTVQSYDFTTSNYKGLCVYLNGTILTREYDYVVSTEGPTLTILVSLSVGDVVTINEYGNTAGNFVPNTPTKLGLYPKYEPMMFYDEDYVNPTWVIQGHDGSITVAFGTPDEPDPRDQVLLEFETRIFSNLKNDGNPPPLVAEDVIPGYFRTTDYTQTEINQILGEDFLAWVGGNKLDYTTQVYIENNPFTYNYSQSANRLDNKPLLGAWRGIYRWFYDTLTPNITPWEMLGFSEEPVWWAERYGPRPYTSDNLVLWGDLEAGLVADPVAPYVIPKYRRPGLTQVIPVDSQGQLLPPFYSVMGPYNPQGFVKSWQVGDGGPVEASWWMSSSYPFAVMRLLLLTRPAEFFSLFADRDLYRYSAEFDQYLYNGRYRLQPQNVQVYGNGVSKASYINWIVDYNQQMAKNSTDTLTKDLTNLDVRLCYRAASFVAQQNLNIYLEKGAPQSQNDSLLIPPESYNLILYKNQPFNRINYSSVIVEVVEDGYSVYGYSTSDPYFTILISKVTGTTQTLTGANISVNVPNEWTALTKQIPYGYVFTNLAGVVDFLLSYGQYLTSQGLTFVTQENGYTLNWPQMAQEFLYFAEQDWATGTIINLNPSAIEFNVFKAGAVVDSIVYYTPENLIVDQNRKVLDLRNLIIYRQGNDFKINTPPGLDQTISHLQLQFTDYENMIVFDNVTVFNDLIYDPTTAERQSRLNLIATTSTEWNGILNAQGFILNQDNVKPWEPNRKYTKGDIVIYKNSYWQAITIVPPKVVFDFNDWFKSNYDRIQQGLLQNLATKADQLANTYDTQTANLNTDNDLLAFSLIGFQPRQYMSNLNLSNSSQVQLYQQFIKTMGSKNATDLFTQVNFNNETAQYNIYETWGIQVGTYGAQANRSWFEVALNEAVLNGNPSTFQIIEPGQTSEANQAILLSNLWAQSYAIPNANILPTTFYSASDTALPSAGYVNFNDIDITVFNLNNPATIAANLESIGNGTRIWVAQDNSYSWNVYQCAQVGGRLLQLTDNLDGTSRAQFSQSVNLATGDLIIIRFFNTGVDGVYRVLSRPTIDSVVIQYAFTNSNQTTITGIGIVFYLQSMRVSQPSDIINLPYANQLVPGATAWVDNDGEGHWVVLEKTDPFSSFAVITASNPEANSLFGTSVSQSSDYFAMLVGAPGSVSGQGSVYTYRLTETNEYVENAQIELSVANVVGFGSSIDFGDRTWAAVGAPGSNSGAGYAVVLYLPPLSGDFVQAQLFVEPTGNVSAIGFGSSVEVSPDERWMYIGAPDANKVYAYGRVDVPQQEIRYTGNGSQFSFNYGVAVEINPIYPNQLYVIVNNTAQVYGPNYTLSGPLVQFTVPPAAGDEIIIGRRRTAELDSVTRFDILSNSTTGFGAGATFTVTNTRGDYFVSVTNPGINYQIGDDLIISYVQIDPSGSAANDLTITVDAVDTGGGITAFSQSGSGITNTSVFFLPDYLYTATSYDSFSVYVDNVLQRPYFDYTFLAGTLTFLTLPAPGARIVVQSALTGAYWKYVDSITVPGIGVDAKFGTSIASDQMGQQIIIGAPFDSALDSEGNTIANPGAVYAFDRSVFRYIITNPAQLTYAIPGTFTDPVSVKLNNQFLTNSAQYLNGQFTVSGSNIVLSDSLVLNIGDTIDIETNQFQQLEKFASNVVIDEAQFGHSADICSNSCSVYIGAPFDSYAAGIAQAGLVQRQVNQSRIYGVITSTVANPTLNISDTIRINLQEVAVPADNTVAGLVEAINNAQIPNAFAQVTPDVVLVGDGTTQNFDIGNIYSSASSYTPVVYLNTVLQTLGVNYTYNNTTQQISFVVAPELGDDILVQSGRMTLSVINPLAAEEFNKLSVLPGSTGTAFDDLGFNTYLYTQTIISPNPTVTGEFGSSVNVNTGAINLVVGSPNGDVYEPTFFDDGQTFFDQRSTTFFGYVNNSGVIYTYDYLPSASLSALNPGNFVFGQQIFVQDLSTGDRFGEAVNYRNGRLVVGAPGNDLPGGNQNYGSIAILDNAEDSAVWQPVYRQLPVVDVNLLNSVYSYDKLINGTQTYFDYIDPLQGKILGAARRNIDYIGAVDPASYNVGTVHNIGTTWGAEHLGEIWWDTNSVRFVDANQDNIVYASRRWGQVFPGSTIDIYQWTASNETPANYTGTGTPFSLTSYSVSSTIDDQGIVITTYYYWVRGITTTASRFGKTLSTTAIASYIIDPSGSGLPYIAALNANTVAIYNSASLLSANDTILHIEYDRLAAGGTNDIHTEYEFIAAGRAKDFLNDTLYRKLLDSFCGVTTTGLPVPDPFLSPGMQYGVQFRPRQSMFIDRFKALQNYLDYANRILLQYPISETRSFTLLNASSPVPSQTIVINAGAFVIGNRYIIATVGTTNFTAIGAGSNTVGTIFTATGPGSGTGSATFFNWNYAVADLTELSYQDLSLVPIGWRYLVYNDASQDNRWTIYEVDNGPVTGQRVLNLIQIQSFNTPAYWNYVDWYLPGYNSSTQPVATVTNTAGLQTLSLSQAPLGSSVKVASDGQNNWQIYRRIADVGVVSSDWERVGIENGTIQIDDILWNYPAGGFGFDSQVFDSNYFDQEPSAETRFILRAINEELFTDDLLIFRNEGLILMFHYIYSEFTTPDWLFKTSYIDVDHVVRGLYPYELYQFNNQTFVEDYLTEVKPYHVQTLNFNLIYEGLDTYPGALTDYDVPAYWNVALEIPQFVSPILVPYDYSGSVVQSFVSDTPSNAQIWEESPWKYWFNNYLLNIESVTVLNGGSGYTSAPTVTVTGTCVTPATMTAVINGSGQVTAITIDNPGSGYSTTAIITLSGGGGTGARAVATMSNNLVRSIKTTIKYDRYEYFSTIVEWQPNVVYATGDRVRYNNVVWEADSTQSSPTFVTTDWSLVPAEDLSGVDRTMGFYVPTVNMPGLSLPLLIDGVEYPGVQVQAPRFDQNTGFDVGNYDINPYDNISYDASGRPTYDPGILDAKYSSSYLDLFLGTRPTDINVSGGEYIDTFSSYAPEELIPGSEFDTLDLRVYTTPGADWLGRGHGFPSGVVQYNLDVLDPEMSFAGVLPYPALVLVSNETQGIDLHLGTDYTVDYVAQTITLIPSGTVIDGDLITITVYEIGGGNQLFKGLYNGADVGDTIVVPVQFALIEEFAVFVNGVVTTDYTYVSTSPTQTTVTFGTTYTGTDSIALYAIGPTQLSPSGPSINYSWSAPQTQLITAPGSVLSFTLDNSLMYVNPDCLVVTVNGVRARTAGGARYAATVSTTYALPGRLGFSQSIIADSDVHVYVNDIAQVLNTDFVVDAFVDDSTPRTITFLNQPDVDDEILIYVLTNSQCYVSGDQLIFDPAQGLVPILGDIIAVTTWNDTRQQRILAQCFVGPISTGAIDIEAYDSTNFDVGSIINAPGSYDYSAGIVITSNSLDLGVVITNPDRLWVSLNGRRLFANDGFTVSGTQVILSSGLLSPGDVVMITQFTDSIVPQAMAFRIFQDMRGVQATYRITPETTTTTTAAVAITDDIIYVDNVNALIEPSLDNNLWGVLTIGAERIMYRYRDTVNNTVSGLLRGTAGTAIMNHASGATVYNMGRGNLLPEDYQDYIIANSTLADGTATVFTAEDINLLLTDSAVRDLSLEVYVGGILVTTGYTVTADNPAEITFDEAPPEGVEVTMLVRRGVTWYAPGVGTPSNGEPLQITETKPARFLRGL